MLRRTLSPLLLAGVLAAGMALLGAARAEQKPVPAALNFTVKDIDGKPVPLSRYHGQVVLITNVASFCGNTPQYSSLEKLYQTYHGKGFTVLGFPSNDFGKQEPGTEQEIK